MRVRLQVLLQVQSTSTLHAVLLHNASADDSFSSFRSLYVCGQGRKTNNPIHIQYVTHQTHHSTQYTALQIWSHFFAASALGLGARELLERVRIERVHSRRLEDLRVRIRLPLGDAEERAAVDGARSRSTPIGSLAHRALRLGSRNAAATPELKRLELVEALAGAAAG